MQEFGKVPIIMKKTLYLKKDISNIREAKFLISLINGCKSKKFVLKAIVWTARRKLKKLDNEYFKLRVKNVAKKFNIPLRKYKMMHFEVFILIADQIMTGEKSSEEIAKMIEEMDSDLRN